MDTKISLIEIGQKFEEEAKPILKKEGFKIFKK